MPSPTPRALYSLEEAFELLGTHLYGNAWTGWEITATPVDDPDGIDQQRAELDAQLKGIASEIADIDRQIATVVEAEAIKERKEQLVTLSGKRSDLNAALSDLPVIDDRHRQRHDRFHRRQHTERLLIEAFSTGALHAFSTRGLEATGIPKHLWQGENGFQYYLELSLVVLPREQFGKRCGSVKLRSTEFDAWLVTVERIVVDPETPLTPEEQATIWFRRFIEQHTGIPAKHGYAIHLMRLEVHDLSGAGALRVWRAHAPKHWKRSGPRSARIR